LAHHHVWRHIRMRLFLFASLLRFDKKLFYHIRQKCYEYSYRPTVNTQHSACCLVVCFPGMMSWLTKVNKSSGAHCQRILSKIVLFFDVQQYSYRFDYIKDRRREVYFNNQTNHCISPLKVAPVKIAEAAHFQARYPPSYKTNSLKASNSLIFNATDKVKWLSVLCLL